MAGYDGFSKSNNAIGAESRGLMTASAAAKITGVPSALIKKYCRYDELHHTSGWFNLTEYYDVDVIRITFGLPYPEIEFGTDDLGYPVETKPEAVAALTAYQTTPEQVWTECIVEWLEWGGSRTHPTCTERKESSCIVRWKGGSFCEVTLPSGQVMKKKTSARGFKVERPATDAERAEIGIKFHGVYFDN